MRLLAMCERGSWTDRGDSCRQQFCGCCPFHSRHSPGVYPSGYTDFAAEISAKG